MLKVTKYQELMPDPFDISIVKIVFFFHEATRYAQSCRTAPLRLHLLSRLNAQWQSFPEAGRLRVADRRWKRIGVPVL
jgi:hypothetical protein